MSHEILETEINRGTGDPIDIDFSFMKMKVWTCEEVFHSGDRFFASLEKSIHQAKQSVFIEIYIFNLDDFGKRMISLLTKAAARGVQIRLLIDGFGSLVWDQDLIHEMHSLGILVRVYHPIPKCMVHFFLPWNLWRLLQWRGWVRVLSRMNRRNHRKVFLIDQKVAFIGSFNISAVHLKEFSGNKAWRDSGVRVEGASVKAITAEFKKVWEISHRKRRRLKLFSKTPFILYPLVKLNHSRSQRRQSYQEVLRRVSQAKKRVWITNPYFVPDFLFLRALRLVAWSGVDVRILLPKKNDIFLMKLANRASYYVLLKAGVRIFEYLPTILHAKILLVDDWAILGSSNRNQRSLIHDLEVDLVLIQTESIHSIESQFLKDLKKSEEIQFSHWVSRIRFYRWLEKVIMIFRNWL